MKYLTLIFVFFISLLALNAQSNIIQIKGQIFDKKSNSPMEFVTVILADEETERPLTGTTTDQNGKFQLKTNSINYYVEISFMGYKTKRITDFVKNNKRIDLGKIVISEDSETLDEVVVRADKSTTEFKLDKRVFNVGKDLSSTGASALEVLNNVPSVTVNIEGQISLRGSSGVQMLINGKPSVLASEDGNALGTLTADMIEKVEVITNPSAKYDAEGTAGIINIVLKKEEKRGLNGSITLNTGFPNNHSVGLSVNKRTEKFNLFSQFGVGYRTFPGTNESNNKNLVNNSGISSEGTGDKNEEFYNVILGTDYHINDLNVITLSGNFAFEKEKETANTTFEALQDEIVTRSWDREELTKATNPKYQYDLQYKKEFKDNKDHHLLFSATGDFFGKNKESEFGNTAKIGSLDNTLQKSRTDFKEAEYTFKLDYAKPIRSEYNLELGTQYQINDVTNDYEVSSLVDDSWIVNSNLTNIFDYKQSVLGVYSTMAYEGTRWGIKGGIRMENTDLKTELKNTSDKNDQKYTDWFPSIHTSYKISKSFSLQAGYSRRISRPSLWSLNPFFSIRNNYNIYQGNPDLDPEYSDSYEISSVHIFKKSSLNFSIYHRFTTDVMERVITFEDNVSTLMPENIGTNAATGFEINGKYNPARWISLSGEFNMRYFKREGEFNDQNFDFTGNSWSSRLRSKFKLPGKIDFEITGNYRSKFKTYQSIISDNFFVNLGVRKKILKGKGVINVSVRDLFASRVRESTSQQENVFYSYSRRQRGRFITVGFSYGFGKGEAMEFSGSKRF